MVIKTRTNVYQTTYHLVFVTKYRQSIFTTKEQKNALKIYFQQIANNHEIHIITQEIKSDYAHLLVSFPPHYSISQVVKKLKGSSARYWFMNYPETKSKLWKGHLWSSSYFVGTIGNVSTNMISDYIKNQHNKVPNKNTYHNT